MRLHVKRHYTRGRSWGQQFAGKQGLVLGVANKRSIAWAIARRLADEGAGARVHVPGRTDRGGTVRELAETCREPARHGECDVRSDDDLVRVFSEVAEAFDRGLDLLVHSVAFATRPRISRAASRTRRATASGWRSTSVPTRSWPARGRRSRSWRPRRRLDRHDDVPRRRARGAALQRHGRGEGHARRLGALPRVGSRLQEHPRERDLRRPHADAGGPLHRRFPDDGDDFEERAPLHRQIGPTTVAQQPPICFPTMRRTSPARRSTSIPGTSHGM